MERFLYHITKIANVLALLVLVFFLLTEANRVAEFIVLALCALPPVLSLMTIYGLPDMEGRKLERDVHKARLRKELEELGE